MNEVHKHQPGCDPADTSMWEQLNPGGCRCNVGQVHSEGTLATDRGIGCWPPVVDASQFIIPAPELPADVTPVNMDALDGGLYLAVSVKSGELITRNGRLLFATRAEWDMLPSSLPIKTLISTAEHGVPFGALPLMDRGNQPDIVGDLVSAINSIEQVADAAIQRLATLDKVIEYVTKQVAK